MSKKEKKSKKKRRKTRRGFRIFIVILVFSLVIIFALVMLGAYVFKTDVKSITIYGNNILTDEQVMEIGEVNSDSNFYLTSGYSIEKKLKETNLVKEVDLKRNLLFEFKIYITEYKPLFYREDTKKIVLNNGKEIDKDKRFKINVPSLVNYVPDTIYPKLVKKVNSIDYDVLSKVSDIKYSPTNYDEERFILYMNDSNRVYINLPKFKSLNKYDEMVEKFEGKKGKLYLDSGNYFEID